MDSIDGIALHFPNGLPGFETVTRFTLKEQPSLSPVAFLKSVDTPDLCFLVIPVQSILPDYGLSISSDDLRTLALDDSRLPEVGSEVHCLTILTVPEQGPLTANLLAPVVINMAAGLAVQAVRADAVYSHRHEIGALQAEVQC
jgi:flagellar assembly factor FliW